MSYFNHCHNLLMLVIFIFLLLVGTSVANQENSFEMLSSADMVEIAGYGHEKLSSVLVTGTVVCEGCLRGQSQLQTRPISGALVAVSCRYSRKKMGSSLAQAVTDEHGEFIIDLPSHLHATPHLHKRCSVRVLKIPKASPCRLGYLGGLKGLKLSSFGNGIRTYTAGDIKFLHPKSRPTWACTRSGNSGKDMAW